MLRYYAHQVPYVISITLPLSMLLAGLFTVGQMTRRNELVAVRSSGVSIRRTLTPLLVLAALVSGLALAFNEYVVPPANQETRRIEDFDIKKKPRRSGAIRRNVHLLGEGGRVFLVRAYDMDHRILRDVVVQWFSKNTLVQRLDAEKAEWSDGGWDFHDGFVRTFSDSGETADPFRRLRRADITETPEDFRTEEKDPEDMNFVELGEYIRKVRAGGSDTAALRVERHLKIAFPFANLIVVLLGGALSAVRRKSGVAFGFGVSLALCFVYYGILRVGQAAGQSDLVPAPVAAWAANAVFLAAGLVLLIRAER